MIDEIIFKYVFNKSDSINLDDIIDAINVHLNPRERIVPEDVIYIELSKAIAKIYEDRMEYKERIANILVSIIYSENANIQSDGIHEYTYVFNKNLKIPMNDDVVNNSISLTFKDSININDTLYKEIV